MIGALIGGLGTAAGGIFGAMASQDANEKNWQINLMNYYARERERRDQMAEARINKRENQLGMTDADGNSTKFVPGEGWVTTLSDESKQLNDLQKQEQLNVLTKDLPMRRRFMDRNETRSYEDESTADTLRRDMRTTRRGSDEELEALLYNAATNRMSQAYDEAQATTVREAQRTGSSNITKMLQGLNRDRAASYADAAMEAKLRARGSAEQEYQNKIGGLANLYNMFATRASVGPDVSYRPQNVDAGAGQMASQLSKQGIATGQFLAESAGKKGGTIDYVQPDYGWANAIGSGSRALGSMFKGMASGAGGMDAQKYDNRLRD